MATIASESFEGGSNGVQLSTSNTSYTAVTLPADWTFSTSTFKSGSASAHLVTTTAQAPILNMTFGATPLSFHRWYIKILNQTTPAGTAYSILNVMNTATRQGDIQLLSDGTNMTFKIRNLNLMVDQTTVPITLNQWFRLEYMCDQPNLNQELRFFQGVDVDNPSSAWTDRAVGAYTQAVPDQFNFGFVATQINELYVDEYKASNNNWVGPLTAAAQTNVSINTLLVVGG